MKLGTRSSVRVLLTAMAICLTAACSLDPTRLPVPGAYSPDHAYRIKIQFSSVLNLPARAKVDSGGVQIGVLDHVQLDGTTAVAYVDIAGGTKLPGNTRAELRQATPLGDIYIALVPPEDRAGDTAMLRDGGTIPLRNTAPADNVEDLLRSVSNLVAGGAIGTLQSTVVNVNKSFPKNPAELTRMQQTLAGVLNDLAANQDTIDGILSSMENITTNMAANTAVFNRLVTEGPPKLEGLSAITMAILDVVGDSRDVSKLGGELTNPITGDIMQMLSYLTPMVGTVATLDTTIPVLADKLIAFLHYKLLGFFRNGGPKYIVSELHPPTGHEGVDPADKADQAVKAMQSMGMLP
ncbi:MULTISPECIES: MlaD family protein [unclassified Mycobacterium]|uniref:MlaD family protein n=1 Tax=unclassified Mycobacterium TaxID=2642494 RepID=UPI0007FF734C|nr:MULTISPECIES: MlaD family protein [unclassified Mycobacterium]OBH00289.1 mammalian cell entry protein [Mycobacterium sp. E2699]OBI48691.1 mammalian cell entry protein [Mycobacterium sp. E787]